VFPQSPHPPASVPGDYYLFPKNKSLLPEIKVPVSKRHGNTCRGHRKSTAEVLPAVVLSHTEMCDGRREQLQKQCAVKPVVMTGTLTQEKTTDVFYFTTQLVQMHIIIYQTPLFCIYAFCSPVCLVECWKLLNKCISANSFLSLLIVQHRDAHVN
jgi:hypothetical protein